MAENQVRGAISERIRREVVARYIEPARRRGEVQVRVVAGAVAKELDLGRNVPQVCSALRAKKFLDREGLQVSLAGPKSGQSTTVALTFRIAHRNGAKPKSAWDELDGIMRGAFDEFGGGEAWLKKEREEMDRDFREREKQMWSR